ncbi:MAG TPA: bifunctional glutamate N-acetyltransferase/amino-acid acetyltransferase ArgJ [Polyangiaceae bacterium]|nr:bifunctional glutamate N-acetyltransferase/amino-acid acetyltransferase ArgJ [Polyangiaceae bacterium]
MKRVFDDWNVLIETAASNNPSDDVVSFFSRSLDRNVAIERSLIHQPEGIRSAAMSAGIKHEGVLDFAVVRLDDPGAAAGVFTTNMCPGSAIPFDREVLADGRAQALVVVSKNANVFTPRGEEDTRALARGLAVELGVEARDVVVSFTGVIGVPLPMDKVQAVIVGVWSRLRPGSLDEVSRAILTTDRGPKVCSVRIGDLVVCGMAKGAGMIEPNMATLLVYFFTNADVTGPELRGILGEAVDRTFNSLSVDSDTSTSDSVVIFSTRRVPMGDAARSDFVDALRAMSAMLARDVVAQSEGATKLVECTVRVDTSPKDAKIVAKKIVNSPLVKTALHGGDPNWGRVVMAIGKPDERLELKAVAPREVTIEMMGHVVYEQGRAIPLDLLALGRKIKDSTRVAIDVRIGQGRYAATVWGCDLSRRYVDINADYTT